MSSFLNTIYNWVSDSLCKKTEYIHLESMIKKNTIYGPSDLYVFTDLEPDDYLALWILNKNGYNFSTIVVGEGKCVDQKARRTVRYLTDPVFNISSPNILKGDQSDKDFPKFDDSFELYKSDENFSLSNLKEYVQSGGTKIIIIKPPREFFHYIKTNPTELSFLSKTKCYLYGSFNMKSLDATENEFKIFCDLFGEFYLYESFFATGPQNNMNVQNFPLIQKLRKNTNFAELLDTWDDYILKDCEDTCIELLKKYNLPLEMTESKLLQIVMSEKDFNSYEWNYKCYSQVKSNKGFQTVLADSGLAVTIDIPQFYKKGNIQFGTLKNTSVSFNENGKHFICVSDFDTIVNHINTVFEE